MVIKRLINKKILYYSCKRCGSYDIELTKEGYLCNSCNDEDIISKAEFQTLLKGFILTYLEMIILGLAIAADVIRIFNKAMTESTFQHAVLASILELLFAFGALYVIAWAYNR